MVTGTLGAGGSERQLVLTLEQLKALERKPLHLSCMYLETPAQRFYLGEVQALGVAVTVLSKKNTTDPALRRAFSVLPPELGHAEHYVTELCRIQPKVAHLWLDETNVKAGLAAVACAVPRIVLSLRSLPPINFEFHQAYMREAYRWLATQPGVVFVNNSHAGARAYEKWINLPPDTIKVIHNGYRFDSEVLATFERRRGSYRIEHGIPADRPLIGVVFRMSEEKRPFLWFDIASRIRKYLPDVHFLAIGDGLLREQIVERTKQKDLAGHVTLVKYEKEVLRALVDMDLFLLTSRAEGLPNVLVEAQAMGVPVVTTPVGGAPETLLDGRTGYLLPSDEPDEAADVIVRLIKDRGWRAKASAEAKRFALEHFGVDRMMADLLELYDDDLRAPDWGPKRRSGSGLEKDMTTPQNDVRFEFGENWKDFIGKNFSLEIADVSKHHILDFMGRKDLKDLTFLDIGCGSGLHSLAALQAGVGRIHGFDYDPTSVAASKMVHEKVGKPQNWTIEQGSVLNDAFIEALPKFDIVYSWGVLHHTGDVWHAIRNAASRVADGGSFYIALYSADVQVDPTPEFWLDVKRKYVSAGWLTRRSMDLWYIWRFCLGRKISRLPEFLRMTREYKNKRGMNMLTDIRDWLGGWPMEFVYDQEAVDYVEKMGFKLEKIATGEANTEFLFTSTSPLGSSS